MVHECQNPTAPHRKEQQFSITHEQELNVHALTFAPIQYYATAPLMSQLIMSGPMPFSVRLTVHQGCQYWQM